MPRVAVLVFSLAAMVAPAALAQSANLARPGTLNYVEGSAYLAGQPLNAHSIGSAELEPGEVLETATGKAELLLTPGVFLRIDDNSIVKMVSPGLTNTRVELERGRATVEVDQILKQNDIQISLNGSTARLLQEGLYEFDANTNTVRVFHGKAAVSEGNGDNVRPVEVKSNRQLSLAAGPQLRPADFDSKNAQDDLYNWSSLRSQYLSNANTDLAVRYAGASGFASGWYWDAGLWGYTWLPGDGLFWNPFGWGFYSPYWIYGGGPIYRGRFGGGYRSASFGHVSTVSSGFRGGSGGFAHGGGLSGGTSGGFHGGGGGGHR